MSVPLDEASLPSVAVAAFALADPEIVREPEPSLPTVRSALISQCEPAPSTVTVPTEFLPSATTTELLVTAPPVLISSLPLAPELSASVLSPPTNSAPVSHSEPVPPTVTEPLAKRPMMAELLDTAAPE